MWITFTVLPKGKTEYLGDGIRMEKCIFEYTWNPVYLAKAKQASPKSPARAPLTDTLKRKRFASSTRISAYPTAAFSQLEKILAWVSSGESMTEEDFKEKPSMDFPLPKGLSGYGYTVTVRKKKKEPKGKTYFSWKRVIETLQPMIQSSLAGWTVLRKPIPIRMTVSACEDKCPNSRTY